MKKRGLKADAFTHCIILKGLADCGSVRVAEEKFESMKMSASPPDGIIYAVMLGVFARNRMIDKAEAVLAEMRKMGTLRVSDYNCLLTMYRIEGRMEEVEKLLNEMIDSSIPPTERTSLVIMEAARALNPSFRKFIHPIQSDSKIQTHELAHTTPNNSL